MAVNPVTRPTSDASDCPETLIPTSPLSISMDETQIAKDFLKSASSAVADVKLTPIPNGIPASAGDSVLREADTSSLSARLTDDAAALTAESANVSGSSTRQKHTLQKCAPVDDGSQEVHSDSHVTDSMSQFTGLDGADSPLQVNCVVTKPLVPQQSECVDSSETSPDTSPQHDAVVLPCSAAAVLEDPATCSIEPGRPTRISISKGKSGLGVRIIGGADTMLKSIVIYEIYDDGAAAKDDRLSCGDQILQVNGEDLQNASHSRAVHALRRALTEALSLIVLRSETAWNDLDFHDVVNVDLVKKPSKGLGLSIVSRRRNAGIIIADIVRGGVAESDGRLATGDQILKVNGEDVSNTTQETAAVLLKTLMGKVSLTVARLKPGLIPNQRIGCSMSLKKSESVASECKNTGRPVTKKRRRTSCASAVGCFSHVPDRPDSDSADESVR